MFNTHCMDVSKYKKELLNNSYVIIDDFITPSDVDTHLDNINNFTKTHELQVVERQFKERSLRYQVIDGHNIRHHLPSIVALYEKVHTFVGSLYGESLSPTQNHGANLNVNITGSGGEYDWHYDRNEVTALLYLNRVAGGNLDFYPNYRLKLPKFLGPRPQRLIDSCLMQLSKLKKPVSVPAAPGRLVIMRGEYCLHSVAPVSGHNVRKNIVMRFDKPKKSAQQTQTSTVNTHLDANNEWHSSDYHHS